MSTRPTTSTIGLLLSGGLDSSILAGHLLRQGRVVQPLFVHSRLVWQEAEWRAAKRFLEAIAQPRLRKPAVLELPLADLYEGHWSVTGLCPPDSSSADEAVYLPGRNALLMVKAALWCQLHGVGQLALAVLGSSPFADATSEFFDDFESAMNRSPDGRIRIIRPFARFDKSQVMQLGSDLPLELTFSCIAPVDGLHCGECNKCAERSAAFGLLDSGDPTRYATDGVGAG